VILPLKLVAMATSLQRSEKKGRIAHVGSIRYCSWKFYENRSSTSWDNWSSGNQWQPISAYRPESFNLSPRKLRSNWTKSIKFNTK